MGRYVALVLALVIVTGLGFVLATYHRQIASYLTHRKGGPSVTWAYVPHDPPPDVHLAVVGDVGEPGSRIEATGARLAMIGAAEPYDALILLGDNAYPDGNPEKLTGTVFEPFAGVLDEGAELMAIVGNHDVNGAWCDAQLSALGIPGRYWAEELGDVLVVGLDSTDLDATQLEFLDATLSATTATWKIVLVHHPPYSSGYQGSCTDVREALAPLLEEHGVQLVLSGHDHDYQRTVPIGGVTYVVSGAGAITRRTGEDDFTAAAYSWHHVVDIAITDGRLELRAVGQDGSVFDEIVLTSEH